MDKEILKNGESGLERKRPNFFYWYYNDGIHELLEIWKNHLFFVWRNYSILELFRTLFSPWRRDVTNKNWRGLHPLKTLEIIFDNLFSRLIGALVRILIILFGLIVFAVVLILGIVATFIWISAPLLVIVIFVYAFRIKGLAGLLFAGGLFLLWAVILISCYLKDTKRQVIDMGLDEIPAHPVFERICGRLGLDAKRFPKEIFPNHELMEDFLKARGLTIDDFGKILDWEIQNWQNKEDSKRFWHWENLRKRKPIGMQWRYAYTVNLDNYCRDLSVGDFSEYSKTELIGRRNEYEIIKLILQRPDQNCVLLVGNAGIGKKTVIHSLARKIRTGEEKYFENFRILSLDLGKAISEALNRGHDIEDFMRTLFFEASYAGNVILVIEHLEQFLGKESNTFHPDISAVIAEFLEVPTFQIIATSTTKEYHQLIEKQEQIVKYFEIVEMREPSEDEAMRIVLAQLEKYEQKRILFTFKAIKEIIAGSGKYNWEFPLPERALDLAMDVFMFWEKKSDEQFITEKTVGDYLTLKTGVQQGQIEGSERKKLLNLEEMLHRQIIGQEEAVSHVSEALRRSRSGIGNSKKPIGSFLFLGPTGVGKTETAKALAKTYFGDEARMIRLDMSEFQSPSSIDRLLGSSHLNQPGRLVTQIKDNPCSLLLLDEIEKAYPEVLDIFLQILDEGFVTDAFGEKVNFTNTIIIATSNAGAPLIKKMVEENAEVEEIKQAVINYAIENNIFRTEFLNRFEGVIFFRPLNAQELISVVRLQLQKFARRVEKEKNIEIVFDDSIIENIIQKGYDPIFGARSLNRYIEDTIEGIVAKKIISGEVAVGGKMIIGL